MNLCSRVNASCTDATNVLREALIQVLTRAHVYVIIHGIFPLQLKCAHARTDRERVGLGVASFLNMGRGVWFSAENFSTLRSTGFTSFENRCPGSGRPRTRRQWPARHPCYPIRPSDRPAKVRSRVFPSRLSMQSAPTHCVHQPPCAITRCLANNSL